MTVILISATFAILLLIDFVRSHQPLVRQAGIEPVVGEAPSLVVPALVAGFQVPENVRYHPGHTWALSETRELVRVGVDDFASKLIGNIEGMVLPQRERWVRQGQKDLDDFPRRQAGRYGFTERGHSERCQRSGSEKPFWAALWPACGRKIQPRGCARECRFGWLSRWPRDGGIAVDDITAQLPREDWYALTKEFFLT